MPSLLLTSFLDVARSLGLEPFSATPDSVEAFIRRELRGGGGTFNYNSSITCLPDLFKGELTVEQAEQFCGSHGSPTGWTQNISAVIVAGSYAVAHRSNCYKIPFTAVPIGRLSGDRIAFMSVKAPLVRVENDNVFVVVPGFRIGHRPTGTEIDVAASLALANFARDDFAEADFEYLDCSRGISGERELQVYRGAERRVFDLEEVDTFLNVFVRGLDRAIQSGMEVRKPNFRGYRVIDPDQPRMM